MQYINSLDYDKNLFIFGEEVETQFGIIRFLTYREYLSCGAEISLISQNTLHIYYNLKTQLEKAKAQKESFEVLMELKETDLIEIVMSTEQLLNAYLKIFQLVFDKNEDTKFEKLFESKEVFNFVRQLIMDMNVITEEKVSPNEEIQKAMERSKRLKKSPQELTFVDIVTSIVASTSNNFEDVCGMNVFQIYAIYARVGAIYSYQTSTLFATVAEKVNIESWNKHIDLFKSEDDAISKDEFDKKFGGLLQM